MLFIESSAEENGEREKESQESAEIGRMVLYHTESVILTVSERQTKSQTEGGSLGENYSGRI